MGELEHGACSTAPSQAPPAPCPALSFVSFYTAPERNQAPRRRLQRRSWVPESRNLSCTTCKSCIQRSFDSTAVPLCLARYTAEWAARHPHILTARLALTLSHGNRPRSCSALRCSKCSCAHVEVSVPASVGVPSDRDVRAGTSDDERGTGEESRMAGTRNGGRAPEQGWWGYASP